MTAPTCIYASYAYIQIRTRKLVQEINSINFLVQQGIDKLSEGKAQLEEKKEELVKQV